METEFPKTRVPVSRRTSVTRHLIRTYDQWPENVGQTGGTRPKTRPSFQTALMRNCLTGKYLWRFGMETLTETAHTTPYGGVRGVPETPPYTPENVGTHGSEKEGSCVKMGKVVKPAIGTTTRESPARAAGTVGKQDTVCFAVVEARVAHGAAGS